MRVLPKYLGQCILVRDIIYRRDANLHWVYVVWIVKKNKILAPCKLEAATNILKIVGCNPLQ